MPTTWTVERQNEMFKHILVHHDIKVDYKSIAELMGDNVTPKAIQHRIAGIKTAAKELEKPAGITGSPKTPKTPKTMKIPKTPKVPKTPKETKASKGKSPLFGKSKKRSAAALDGDHSYTKSMTSPFPAQKKLKTDASSTDANDGSTPHSTDTVTESEGGSPSANPAQFVVKSETTIKAEAEDSDAEE